MIKLIKNEFSALDTSYYLAKQFLPDKPLFLKQCVIEELKEVGIMKIRGNKWIIQE
jgi:hypothetical protein